METPTSQTLETANARLANAQASRIEFDLAKSKRELLTIPEAFDLLRRLKIIALDKVSWQEKSVLETHLDIAIDGFQELIKRMQDDAKR